MHTKPTGSLVCVGTGMMLGAHLGPLARSHIEQADVVFVLVADALMEAWVGRMNPDVRSLQPFYSEGASRMRTYRAMVEAMLAEVRAGRKVCGAFYGHPGVFAWVPHKAIETARAEGFFARMEPGVSSEDCLYADVGIDPGRFGCQHFEATQFMLYRRRIDPSAWLVLWQVGLAGDRTLKQFATDEAHRRVLVEVLTRDYPLDHEVIVYRAATLPTFSPRIERRTLGSLPQADLGMQDTLAVPPARDMELDHVTVERLSELARGAHLR